MKYLLICNFTFVSRVTDAKKRGIFVLLLLLLALSTLLPLCYRTGPFLVYPSNFADPLAIYD